MAIRSTLALAAGCVLLMASALPAAIDIGEELRRLAPRVTIPDSSVATAKFLLAHRQQLAGEWDAAARTLRELTHRHADDLLPVEYEKREPVLYWSVRDAVHAHVEGGPAELREAYRKLGPALTPTTRPAATRPATLPAHSWPTFGGSADGGAVSAVVVAKGFEAPLYTIDLVNRDPRLVLNNADVHLRVDPEGVRSVFPVADNNQLFFHDGVQLAGVELHSGKPLTAWLATYPDGRFTLDRAIPEEKAADRGMWTRQLQHTLTVTTDHVIAVMGVNRFGRHDDDQFNSGTSLVCLDRKTGQRVWSVFPYPRWNDPPSLHKSEFYGCPRAVGDLIYVLIRDRRAGDSEALFAACFHAGNGAMKWHKLISATAVTPLIKGPFPQGRVAKDDGFLSIPAATPERLYVQSHGALACLDASGGRVLWLSLYPRTSEFNAGGGWFVQPPINRPPWHVNPLIVSSDHLFALPADAQDLLILDAATGRTVKRIRREIVHFEALELSQLLAVRDERLFVASDRRLLNLNWTKYTASAEGPNQLDRDSTFWATQFDGVPGRVFVSPAGVALTTQRALCHLDECSGRVVWRTPRASQGWPDKQGPGNVFAVGGYLIVAGSECIAVHALPK